MERIKSLTALFLSFVLSFQTVFFGLPSRALATSDSLSAPTGVVNESTDTIVAKTEKQVVDSTTSVISQADFSDSNIKGAGFKLSGADGRFVDFRLKDSPPASPITLGDITLFDLPKAKVKYTRSENGLKEEITLVDRPVANEIVFNYSSSKLSAQADGAGGYTLLGAAGEPVFEISAPTVVDAGGKSGKISLDIAGDEAVLRIDPTFLDKAAYPITIDPTVVVTTTGGVGLSSQRNTFFDPRNNNRHWVLYSDAANARAKYSANGGSTWTLATGSITGVTSGSYLSSWFRPTDGVIYVAYRKSYSIYARRGVVSATNIAWDNKEYLVLSGTSATNYYTYPTISQATGGKILVAAKYLSGSNNSIVGRRSSNANSVTSWEASNFTVSATSTSVYLVPQILQTPDGNNYFVWLHGAAVKGRKYDQSTGLGVETTITNTYSADLAHIPSAVTSGTTIYLGLADANQDLQYRTLASPYTGSWSATSALSAEQGDNVVLTLDTTTAGGIYAFYGAPPGASQRVKQVKLGDPNTTLNLNDPPAACDQVVAPVSTSANSFAVWRQGTTVYFSKTIVAPSTSLAIDPSAPNGANGWYKTTPTITLTGSPTSTTTWYRWNSGNVSQYTAPLTNAPAGTDTLSYYSTDTVANQEATQTFSVKVDTTTPASIADFSGIMGQNGRYTSDVTVTVSASDSVSGVGAKSYKVNAGAWTTYTVPFQISTEGTNTVFYNAVDNAGNIESTRQVEIQIDKTNPVTLVAAEPAEPDGDNGWYKTTPIINLTPNEPGATFYQWDSTTPGSWTSGTSTAAPEGIHTLYAYSIDSAGNTETPPVSINVQVDTSLPTTLVSAVPLEPDGEAGWYRKAPTITLTSNKPGSTYYQWDSTTGPWTTYSGKFSAAQGNHALYYYSKTTAGGSESPGSQAFTVDSSAPINPTIASPSHTVDTTSKDNTIDINLSEASDTASGVDGYSFEWSQSAASIPDKVRDSTAGALTSPPLMYGTWFFHLRTKDKAGNWAAAVHSGPYGINIGVTGLEGYTTTYSKATKAANLTVNLLNGNLVAQVSGLSRPARGADVAVEHTYNSSSVGDGRFGYGWTINYARRLTTDTPAGSVTYTDEDGSEHFFLYSSGEYQPPPGTYLSLVKNGDGTYAMTDKAQVKSNFDAGGNLISIIDRNNNTIGLTYSAGKLVTITDASGADTTLAYDANGRLDQITTADGRTNQYGYNAAGDLISVVNAAGVTASVFAYTNHDLTGVTDARFNSTAVTYSNEKAVAITDPSPFSYVTLFAYNGTSTEVDGPRTEVEDIATYDFDVSGMPTKLHEPPQQKLSDSSRWRYRQKITLNTDSIGLADSSITSAPHSLHISDNGVFNQDGSTKFWQGVDSVKGKVAFTKGDGVSVLDYAVKDWDFTNKDAFFDVSNAWRADTDTPIYVYYGYLGGGAYPKTTTDFERAYDSNFKAAYSMNDDPNNSTVQDLTVNNNDGTKASADHPSLVSGVAGKAQDFNGSSDYMALPTIQPAPFWKARNRTIEAWIKPSASALTGSKQFFTGYDTAYSYSRVWFLVENGQLRFLYSVYPGPVYVSMYSGTTLSADTWYHAVVTWDAGTYKMYLNGNLVGTYNNSAVTSDNVFLTTIGANLDEGWYFPGAIDEVRILDTASSTDAIKLSYQAVSKQDDIGTVDGANYIEVGDPEAPNAINRRYDTDLNLISETRQNGATTSYVFDANGNVLAATNPLGATTHYAYDAKNDIVSTTDALGNNTRYLYDTTGNLEKKIDALNSSETYIYDSYGQKTQETNARGYSTTFSLNNLGLETSVTDALLHTTAYSYDAAGNRVTATNPLGKTTSRVYDTLGNPVREVDPLGNTSKYQYDPVGNKTGSTNPEASRRYMYTINLTGSKRKSSRSASPHFANTMGPAIKQLKRIRGIT